MFDVERCLHCPLGFRCIRETAPEGEELTTTEKAGGMGAMTLVEDRNSARPAIIRSRVLALSSVTLLILTMSLPLLQTHSTEIVDLAAGCTGLGVVATTLWIVARHPLFRRRLTVRSIVRAAVDMGLFMSPVIFLMSVFPVASAEMGSTQVGGVKLTTVWLASSVTVPWLSQAVCLPLYRAIGYLILEGDMPKIQARLCQVWPITFLQSLHRSSSLCCR